jgi:aspartyl/glutamyl-tRNA(Asn/Gln) amidotransferase C subunit
MSTNNPIITEREIQYLAKASYLEFSEQDLQVVVDGVRDVLVYATCLQEAPYSASQIAREEHTRMCVVSRQDTPCPSIGSDILAQAPDSKEGFFVVPVIIK